MEEDKPQIDLVDSAPSDPAPGVYFDLGDSVSVDLELTSLLQTLGDKGKALQSVDNDTIPEGGWDSWCRRVGKKGKIARIIRTISKNTMAFSWKGTNEAVVTDLNTLCKTISFKRKSIQAYGDWLKYGRTFIEPVFVVPDEITTDASKGSIEMVKIKIVDPSTIRVFWDNQSDYNTLMGYGKEDKGIRTYLKQVGVGVGDEAIGFMQTVLSRDTEDTSALDTQQTDQSAATRTMIFFTPDELIFIPRYPDHDVLEGMSLLRENYDTIMNKLGFSRSQAIMVKRHADPKYVFTVPKDRWGERRRVQEAIKFGIKAGLDIFVPEGMTVSTLQTSGMGSGVISAIQFTEDEFNASMGFADSFSSSTSSNRAVGEVQLEFFERDVNDEREIFKEAYVNHLFSPYLKSKFGEDVEIPDMVFEDISPADNTENAKNAVPYMPYLIHSQLVKVFGDMGYPDSTDEMEESKKQFEKVGQAAAAPAAAPPSGSPPM